MSACRLILLSAVVMLLSAVTLNEGMRFKGSKNACCYSYNSRPLKSYHVASYIVTGPQCSKEAVVFKTKKGKEVCAKLTESWAKDLMNYLDSKPGSKGSI